MNMKGLYLILLSFLFGCNLPDMQTGKEVSYYFDQPAQIWEETLPLGNGRIGMMPDGGIERENVVLNEISLWSGSKQDTDNPYAYYSLANIRRLLFEGRKDEAQDMFASLRHRTISCSTNDDSTIHLSSTSYHVLYVVGVSRTVNVCVVTVSCFILNV